MDGVARNSRNKINGLCWQVNTRSGLPSPELDIQTRRSIEARPGSLLFYVALAIGGASGALNPSNRPDFDHHGGLNRVRSAATLLSRLPEVRP